MLTPYLELNNIKLIYLQTNPRISKANLVYREASKFWIFIGPEGGFEDSELDMMDFTSFNLGNLILRTDTACIAGVSIFQYLFRDLKPTEKLE